MEGGTDGRKEGREASVEAVVRKKEIRSFRSMTYSSRGQTQGKENKATQKGKSQKPG